MATWGVSVKVNPKASKEVWDGYILGIPIGSQEKFTPKKIAGLPKAMRDAVMAYAKKVEFKFKPMQWLSFDLTPTQRVVVFCWHQDRSMFETLKMARLALEPLLRVKPKAIVLDLKSFSSVGAESLADAFVSASVVGGGAIPETKKEGSGKPSKLALEFQVGKAQEKGVARRLGEAKALAEGTNLVRFLAMQPGNQLDPKSFKGAAKKVATAANLGFEFISTQKLKKLKAGAFLAVCQGSSHEDAGIVKLSYKPKKKGKHLILVGKGITYDTGGVNLKPPRYMFGMQGDMTGAAVALALIECASKQHWPFQVTCYLAIADNAIGDRAYRPNDVITSLSGKTIEVVHTDAEGRMVLADTLALASREKYDLMLNFATLTGACVGAIGTTYMGAFPNDSKYNNQVIQAGKLSGERAWPFPLDEDFGKSLDSDVADLKQCRLSGGVDHIEAAWFLKQFLNKEGPWVHVDLASSEHDGGLGHVGTDVTGTGVRFGFELVRQILGS